MSKHLWLERAPTAEAAIESPTALRSRQTMRIKAPNQHKRNSAPGSARHRPKDCKSALQRQDQRSWTNRRHRGRSATDLCAL